MAPKAYKYCDPQAVKGNLEGERLNRRGFNLKVREVFKPRKQGGKLCKTDSLFVQLIKGMGE